MKHIEGEAQKLTIICGLLGLIWICFGFEHFEPFIFVVMMAALWVRTMRDFIKNIAYYLNRHGGDAMVRIVCLVVLAALLLVPSYMGQSVPLLHAGASMRPVILVVGQMHAEGFSHSVGEYLASHVPPGCDIVYLDTDEVAAEAEPGSSEYRKVLTAKLVPVLVHRLPLMIIAADSSTFIEPVLELAKKIAIPTAIVAATKGGLVSERDNIVRPLPPNVAQAQCLVDMKRDLTRAHVAKWKKEQVGAGGTRTIEEWDAYVERKKELKAMSTADANAAPSLEMPVRHPPKIVFAFIHDGTPFSKDLKRDYFALQGLDDAEVENSGTLIFNCANESDMVTALTQARNNNVCHWFVALYDKMAQDFYREKSTFEASMAADRTASITFCDSAYGEWLLGDKPRRATIALPSLKPGCLDGAEHPLYAPIGTDAATGAAQPREYKEELNRKENCYGPFAYDSVAMAMNLWQQHNHQELFADAFYRSVASVAHDGREVDGGPSALCRHFRFYTESGPEKTDRGDQPKAKQIRQRKLDAASAEFHLFKIGKRKV